MLDKKTKRKRLLIMLPLFVLPLVGILVLFLKGNTTNHPTDQKESAFNATLPSANVREDGKNKLEIYMQAQKDSAKHHEDLLNDPYEKSLYDPAPPLEEQTRQLEKNFDPIMGSGVDPNEKKVNDRLDKLLKEINQATPSAKTSTTDERNVSSLEPNEVKELEKMIEAMQSSSVAPDPEISRLETLLEKVLDIQHPDRVREKIRNKQDDKNRVVYNIVTYHADSLTNANGFYSLDDKASITGIQDNTTILAVVHEDQTVQEGSTIKLQLLQDVFVSETYIPKGNFISGTCQFSGDRINVQLKNIAYKNTIYPISLTVFDTDGLLGINAPGSMTRDVTREGMGQATQDIEVLGTNTTLATQAASTGIQTLKTLLSKKVKKTKATIRAGHRVLLKIVNPN